MTLTDFLHNPLTLIGAVLVCIGLLAATYKLWLSVVGIRLVPDDSIGIVYKKFVLMGKGRNLPAGAVVALMGEAGLQADTLPPGVHYGYWPWQYRVDVQKFTIIPSNKIGVMYSADGIGIAPGRVLGTAVLCDSYQDARKFLTGGGCRGAQSAILPPGKWRINTGLFNLVLADLVDIPDNKIGVVTVKDGAALPTGEIAGAEVGGHSSFQDAEAFIRAKGSKGLQTQVLLAGRYFINPLFAEVALTDLTVVPIAQVGVVIAYVGHEGKDLTGESFKHGNLVSKGERGVWAEPLDPGKYPINPHTHKVELVPTANVVLNWATGKSEAHNLDKNLSTITVRSSDGFTFNLDVSQIIHIPRNEAPKVIARFGNMANLVTQVLEPTIGNYFRNAAQGSDVIDFLKNRQTRQAEAKAAIGGALTDYNVNAVDTLIGDITPPEALMKTLTDRKLAQEQKTTFETEKLAQETRKDLAQAQAVADTQAQVVAAQRTVDIKTFEATAAVAFARGEAEAKEVNAIVDAKVITLRGDAEAGKTLAIGKAEAAVIKQKTDALDANNFASIEIARSLAAHVGALVPEVMVGGGEGGNGGLMNVLLAKMVLADRKNGNTVVNNNGKAGTL